MPQQTELHQRLESMEEMIRKIDIAADPDLRATAANLVQLLMDLQGAALERVLEAVRASGDAGEDILNRIADDELLASLLVLHGLHPTDFETRVRQAVEKTRRRLGERGAGLDLLAIKDGAIRVRIGAGAGCGSTARSLRESVEDEIYQAAPDLVSLTIEDADQERLVPVEMLARPQPRAGEAKKGL